MPGITQGVVCAKKAIVHASNANVNATLTIITHEQKLVLQNVSGLLTPSKWNVAVLIADTKHTLPHCTSIIYRAHKNDAVSRKCAARIALTNYLRRLPSVRSCARTAMLYAQQKDASRAYDAKAREVHGPFARCNFSRAVVS